MAPILFRKFDQSKIHSGKQVNWLLVVSSGKLFCLMTLPTLCPVGLQEFSFKPLGRNHVAPRWAVERCSRGLNAILSVGWHDLVNRTQKEYFFSLKRCRMFGLSPGCLQLWCQACGYWQFKQTWCWSLWVVWHLGCHRKAVCKQILLTVLQTTTRRWKTSAWFHSDCFG